MSAAAVPVQTPPPTAALALKGPNDQGARHSGDAFSNLLQEVTAGESSSSPQPTVQSPSYPQTTIQRGKSGNQKSAVHDPDAQDDSAQTSDAKPQPMVDATAAIAAMIAPQSNGAALAAAQASQNVVTADQPETAETTTSAVRLIAARLNKQAAAASAEENGVVMPSDASSTTPTIADAAPPAVAVHVEHARTFLGVDNVAETTRAKVDSQTLVQSDTQTATTTAAPADSGSKLNVYYSPTGGGASSFAKQNEDAANGKQDRRSAQSDESSIDKSAPSANVSTVAAGSIGTAPIEIDQLPDVIANQAQALVAQSASPATANAASVNPVKELDVSLNPADLGSLTVKMRIANGNLSVVIETEKSSTAKMIESERQAIVDRLGSASQPIASVVIKAADNAPMQGGNNNGSGSATPQHANAQNGSSNGAGSQTGSSHGRDDQAQTRRMETIENDASNSVSTGDLFV
jgi:chemotaxis protein MotD